MAVLKAENLKHVYSAGTPFESVGIHDVSLSIGQGERICLLGHTGSGKSTFVQHLNALLQPTSGSVLLDGEDINRSKISRRDVKRRVGLVFQYPEYQLFEETVYEDIAFGPKNMKLSEAEVDVRVHEAAHFAGVDEGLLQRSPLELSGGQKRRIAIAGVIAMRPEILILDEPTAGLDPSGSRQIFENIRSYRENSGATVIVVSHSMEDAARFFDRLIVFDHGTVCMDGKPEEIFSRADELTAIGLNVPKATELARALKARGVLSDDAVYTHEQLVAAILRAGGEAAC